MKMLEKMGVVASVALLAGCLGGTGGGAGGYGTGAGGYGGYGGYGAGAGGYGAGTAAGGGLQGALLNAIIQSMAGSVLNGQIGSQLAPTDQNFRLQQLGGAVQSGAFSQAQQWVNPQTGNKILLNPLGQQTLNQQYQQQCRNLEETVILQNGQRITERRIACLDPQTGKWNLVQ